MLVVGPRVGLARMGRRKLGRFQAPSVGVGGGIAVRLTTFYCICDSPAREDRRAASLDQKLEDALIGGAIALGLLLPDRRQLVAAFEEFGGAGAHAELLAEALGFIGDGLAQPLRGNRAHGGSCDENRIEAAGQQRGNEHGKDEGGRRAYGGSGSICSNLEHYDLLKFLCCFESLLDQPRRRVSGSQAGLNQKKS